MKYVEVFWAPFTDLEMNSEFENDILFTKPKPYLPMLLNARQGTPYLKCPAMIKIHQNDFVVCAPYDLVLTFTNGIKAVNTDRFGQKFFDASLRTHWGNLPEGMPPIVQGVPRYIMYSFDDVEIELTDLPILTSKFTSNTKIIGGAFNISKWYRPLEVAFEVIDIDKSVELKAGEPMCLLRFRTPNNVPVKLTRTEMTPELSSRIKSCVKVKEKQKGLKLEQLYELAADFIELFKRRNK